MTGSESLVGKTGVVVTDLSPVGEVTVEGITWKAKISAVQNRVIAKGENVRVVRRSGLELEVEPEPIKEKLQPNS